MKLTATADDTETNIDYRLPRLAVPYAYDLSLRPDLEHSSFSGLVTIHLRIEKPTDKIVLNAIDLALDKIVLTARDGCGTSLLGQSRLDSKKQQAILQFDGVAGIGDWSLSIEFRGKLADDLKGFYRSRYKDENGKERYLASTHFEPTHARRAFPCFDEPAYKAVFNITLELDSRLEAISNSRIQRVSELTLPVLDSSAGDNATDPGKSGQSKLKRVEFAPTPPLPSYLVAFIAGDLISSEPRTVTGSKKSTEIRIWCTPGNKHLSSFALDAACFALGFFENYFAIDYPGDKIDHVAIPDFPIGAMENYGCITFRESALLVDEPTANLSVLSRVAEIVMHELSHMWFGDLVTMSWWNGLWLKESFATFMANLCLDAWKPDWKQWEDFSTERALAFEIDSLEHTHPIENPVNNPDEATEMFDVISYQKGCAVLYQLHEFMGAEAFRRGCNIYLQRHMYSNTKTTDLWDALEEGSRELGIDIPVRKLMDSWIFTAGHPLLKVTRSPDPADTLLSSSDAFVEIEIEKCRLLGGNASGTSDSSSVSDTDPVPLPVPVILRICDREGNIRENRVLLRHKTTIVHCGEGARYVAVNAGGSGFYRVVYQNKALEDIKSNLESISTVEGFNLLNDSWTLLRSGTITLTSFLSLAREIALCDHLRTSPILSLLEDSFHHLSRLCTQDQDCRDELIRFVDSMFAPAKKSLGLVDLLDKTARTKKMANFANDPPSLRSQRAFVARTLGILACDEEVLALARDILENWLANYRQKSGKSRDPETRAIPTDPDMLNAAISICAHHGDESLFDEFVLLARELDNPQDKLRILYALSKFQHEELIERVTELCLDGDGSFIRAQDAPGILASLCENPKASSIVWSFFKKSLPEMEARFADIAMARLCLSLASLDRAELACDIEKFFARRTIGTAQTAINQMLEQLKSNLRLREANSKTLKETIKKAGS